MSINRFIAVGRLTKDPELRTTSNGTSVCSFNLAVNRKIQQQGQPDADFISCVAWGKSANNMTTYLHKGSLIGVEGRIQTRSYDNQQGQRVYVTEVQCESVQFLEPRRSAEAQNQQSQPNTYGEPNQAYTTPKTQPQGQQVQYAESLTAQAEQDALNISPDDLPF